MNKQKIVAQIAFVTIVLALGACGGGGSSGPRDSDGDGVPNNQDVFPNDATESVDSDGDGVGDSADAFPNDAAETADADTDGVGNNSDKFMVFCCRSNHCRTANINLFDYFSFSNTCFCNCFFEWIKINAD